MWIWLESSQKRYTVWTNPSVFCDLWLHQICYPFNQVTNNCLSHCSSMCNGNGLVQCIQFVRGEILLWGCLLHLTVMHLKHHHRGKQISDLRSVKHCCRKKKTQPRSISISVISTTVYVNTLLLYGGGGKRAKLLIYMIKWQHLHSSFPLTINPELHKHSFANKPVLKEWVKRSFLGFLSAFYASYSNTSLSVSHYVSLSLWHFVCLSWYC